MSVMMKKLWKSVLVFSLAVGLAFFYSSSAVAAPRDEIMRGVAAMDAGRLTEAEQYFRNAVKEAPLLWEAHYQLGMLLRKQERLPEAAESFQKAESLWVIPETVGWLTDTLYRLGRFAECRKAAERWVKMQPSSLVALDNLGLCAYGEGDYVAAVDAFRRGIVLEEVPERQFQLARSAYGLGDYAFAREAARKGLERMPQARRGEVLLGQIELALGNIAEAKRIFGDKPMLGVTYARAEGGYRVVEVLRNGPAERAGVHVNDFVTHFNGQPLGQNGQELVSLVQSQTLGAQAVLTLKRNGQEITRQATLALDAPGKTRERQLPGNVGDGAVAGNALYLHDVRVEPSQVEKGASFLVVIEITVNTASGEQSVPVKLDFGIVQGSKTLSRTEWSVQVPPGQRTKVIKEIPRAAGEPGAYAIQVKALGAGESAEGSGRFQIGPAH